MMLVSSMTASSFIHRADASATSMSTARFGSRTSAMKSTTSWLVMNSHRPSDAMMSILKSSVRSYVVITGSDTTPAVCATVSPSDRLIARPGMSMCPSHTRAGPDTPSSYVTANTRPPLATMRASSPGESGLLSSVRSTATSFPREFTRAPMRRESPMFATVILRSRIVAITAVLPENSVSMDASASRDRSRRSTSSRMARPGSVRN
mmetsp:Transcript_31042/g.41151  ORF Transcript_31042/g.41151 Transcript_31042/m.41151 type:complete len:207 (-) Transcript_31042:229-849(-)